MVTWACQAAATDWSARPICSMAATKPTVDIPIPPHSSGINMPSRPSAPISRSRSVGHTASSHAWGARGAISFCAKSRQSPTRSRSASVREKSTAPSYRSVQSAAVPDPDVDVLVVGAGITGIYQLHRALEAGFSATLLEAGDGVGGTWYWNRYPGARFDSESYTYAYLFSQELFDDWEWQEHFAEQPETERYLNHVVDRFDLRRHIRFGARVTSAVWDDPSGTWVVTVGDGTEVRARFLVAATGVLSVPYFPDVPGREDFAGESVHTGLWPTEGVDVRGKRVAVIGTGSSGVQVIPAILDEVASLTVYQRTANWCTPLNNAPITAEEQAQLRADFEALREVLNTSIHGFHHRPPRPGRVRRPRRRAPGVLREDVGQPGLHEAHQQLPRPADRPVGERGVVRLPRREGPRHRRGPRRRRAADPPGPPVRREAAAVRHRLLRGVQRPEGHARRPARRRPSCA